MTFNLPADVIQMRNGEPVKGVAICPTSILGLVGEIAAFDIESNL